MKEKKNQSMPYYIFYVGGHTFYPTYLHRERMDSTAAPVYPE